ncbi:hypothetical protein [Mycolicibacterium sarraceniae]|uniref:Uncharacterized protein n=1 Tax=Mycolicibacterium sarraceniae TaxID=1534348 RepID=A0A7I7SY69_9MYCO|nr:hypothetical protein [Mycolicibacterium sarraceniae]BBY61139.1 hypothetical protein MSAR_42750 [Mycolicibacterium sarraceniae]
MTYVNAQPLPRAIRKVDAPLAVIIILGTIAGLIPAADIGLPVGRIGGARDAHSRL